MRRIFFVLFSSIVLVLAWRMPALATAPVINTSEFQDANSNGTIDRIRWTMNGTVTTCTYEAGDWTVNTPGDINVSITGVTCTGLDSFLDINVTADTGETGSSTLPVVSYSNADLNNSFIVSTGTPSAFASTTATDGAGPQVTRTGSTRPMYADLDTDGRVDRVTLWFTESVVASSVISRNSINISNVGDFTGFASDSTTTDLISSTVSNVNFSNLTESSVVDTHDDSGNLELTFQNTYSLVDATGNTTSSLAIVTDWRDVADPLITSTEYLDNSGNDGKIDALLLTLSETVASGSIATAGDFTVSNEGDFTGIAFGASATDLITTSTNTFTIPLGTAATIADTKENSGNLAITMSGSVFMVDLDGGNSSGLSLSLIHTYTDGAAPVIKSISPTDGATSVSPSTNIVITFSEAMDGSFAEGTEYTVTPDPGSFVGTWSNSDQTITLDPGSTLATTTSYAIALSSGDITDELANDTLNVSGTLDGTWSFTTSNGSSGGSSSYTMPAKTYSLDLTSPTGAEANLSAYSPITISWTTGGTGTVAGIDLSYSTNSSATWTLFADNTVNDGVYDWTVPALTNGGTLMIKAEATDLVAILASDVSPAVTIYVESVPTPVTANPTPIVAPVTSGFGLSPVTGLSEPISQIAVGQYIKGASLPTVYYLDPNGTRRPFLNELVFFTWASSFSQVITVTDATLPTLPIGSPVIPRPGRVLVKITSSPQVYAVEPGDATSTSGVLRWIPSEAVAVTVFGADWSDYVIDIPATIISRYTYGTEISSSYVKPAGMKKRSALHN